MNENDLYSPARVRSLFNEMSKTYGFVNLVASFGFTYIWRRVVISKITKRENVTIVDLMTGMGELFDELRRQFRQIKRVEAIDFSPKMCEEARKHALRNPFETRVIEADVFDRKTEKDSADIIISSFGLKTFSPDQQRDLAREVFRILKIGGEFSFIEISSPRNPILKFLYEIYLGTVIPLIGRLCLGNPDNYRQLGIYTKSFENSRAFEAHLRSVGLEVTYFEHFFGCASGVFGRKTRVTL